MVLSLLLALGLLVAPLASAQTTMRPVSDFTNAQTCTFWWFEPPDGQWLFFDYNGFVNDGAGLGLGTTLDGYVKEQALKQGGTKITVVVHGDDVISYGADPTFSYLIFGYVWQEVLYGGAEASTGDFLMNLEFVTDQPPGSPLPNLCNLQDGEESTKISFVGNADGQLRADFGVPEGTPGKAHTSQQGRTVPGQGGPHEDGFPAEKVRIWEAGN